MSREFTVITTLLLACAVLLFQIAMKEPPDREIIRQLRELRHTTSEWLGALPPDFEVQTLDGETFVLSEAIGSQMIILNFFATWCGPCATEIPELNRYHNEHHDEGVLIVAIDVNEQEHVVRQFIDRYEVAFPVALDPTGEIADSYGVPALPTTVVIGTDGRVKIYETGAISNADVTFGITFYEEIRAVEDELPRITPEEYRSLYAQQGHPEMRPVKIEPNESELTGRALELASRLRCPSCGDPVSECEGATALDIKRRLAAMDVEGRSDGEILSELFLLVEADDD
jgi:peroxiredoxin